MQKDEESRRPAYPIASVDNALRLLTLFREHERVRLSEAKEHLGVAHSTAHRLLAMLAYHDFVRQEPDSRVYVAGPALVEIGLTAVRGMDIRRYARPVLEELAARFEETVHLVGFEGGTVRYLDAVESPRMLRVAARTGTALPANCTASGKAMLAELPDHEVLSLFPGDGALPGQTGRSITGRAAFLGELRRVRDRGYARNEGESEDGVASVAVPVPGPHGRPVAALTVSAPLSRLPAKLAAEVAGRLHEDAGRLARFSGLRQE